MFVYLLKGKICCIMVKKYFMDKYILKCYIFCYKYKILQIKVFILKRLKLFFDFKKREQKKRSVVHIGEERTDFLICSFFVGKFKYISMGTKVNDVYRCVDVFTPSALLIISPCQGTRCFWP